jgi:hypothetical protein
VAAKTILGTGDIMIDSSIYQLVGRGVKSVADYDKEAADADMARQQQQIGSLNLMLGRQKADEYTRGVQRADALRRLSGTWGADTTDEQRIASLKNSGFAQEADSLTQTLLKQRETQSKITKEGVDAEKVKLETAHNKLSQVLNVIGSARDQPSYEQALMTLKGAGYDISSVPPQFDPAYVQNAGQQALTAQQRIEALMKQKAFDQGARNDLVGPDGTVNQPVIDAKKAIAKSGASNITVAPGGVPAPVLKQQDELIDRMTTAQSIDADLGGIESRIKDGKLKFGPVGNVLNTAKNAAGFSDEESRNFATFKSTLEKLRNDSLRLNSGVQTEGDAQRAWNELFANINDQKLVESRLTEIRAINKRAAELHKYRLGVLRQNFGASELPAAPITPAIKPSADGIVNFSDLK